LTEEGKIAIRNIRRDAKTDIEELENEHEISEDDAHRALEELQNITDKYTDKISDLLEKKEEEILEE
jgi:ribosome recycling factor